MSYKRDIKFSMTLEEISTVQNALRVSKRQYEKELREITKKDGKAKNGLSKDKSYIELELKRINKLYEFFQNLF